MDSKTLREKLEISLIEFVKEGFPDVREIWHNSMDFDCDGKTQSYGYYFFINERYNPELDDLLSDIEMDLYETYGWRFNFLQFDFGLNSGKMVYSRYRQAG
jgi:hypothetical protein